MRPLASAKSGSSRSASCMCNNASSYARLLHDSLASVYSRSAGQDDVVNSSGGRLRFESSALDSPTVVRIQSAPECTAEGSEASVPTEKLFGQLFRGLL